LASAEAAGADAFISPRRSQVGKANSCRPSASKSRPRTAEVHRPRHDCWHHRLAARPVGPRIPDRARCVGRRRRGPVNRQDAPGQTRGLPWPAAGRQTLRARV